MKRLVFFLISVGMVGCVSKPQPPEFEKGLPPRANTEVPFISQVSEDYCGPTVLAMAVRHAGKDVNVDQMADLVFTRAGKGSLQTDMITGARRQGLIAVPIAGRRALLEELAAGHPVIIFENIGLSWIPNYHYALVTGYDLKNQQLIIHTGQTASAHEGISDVEMSWAPLKFWGLVVLPTTELPASVGEVEVLKAASALEKIHLSAEAVSAYQTILKRWPHSSAAMLGLGNAEYAMGNFPASVQFLKSATNESPKAAILWHNLAIAEGQAHQKQAASESAKKAMSLVSAQDKAVYAETLKTYLLY